MPEEVAAPEAPETEVPAGEAGTEAPPEPQPYTLDDSFVQEIREWGGPEAVRQQRELYQALQTEDGQVDLMVQLLRSAGLGTKEIEYIFSDGFQLPGQQPAAPGEPVENPAETVVTKDVLEKEIAEIQAKYAQELQSLQMQQQTVVIRNAVDNWMESKGVSDPQTQRLLIDLGAQMLPEGDFDPGHAVSALEQAHTMWQAQIEKEAQNYAKTKLGQQQAQPTPLGGGQAGAGEGSEQVDYAKLGATALEVAKKRVRDRWKATQAEEQ